MSEFVDSYILNGDRAKLINDKTRYHFLLKAVEMFKLYDTNNDGAIDEKEFHKVYKELVGKEKKEEEKVLVQIDVDQNGRVLFHEFIKWLKKVPFEKLTF